MISQSILYQIKAHEKLHLWVSLEQLLPMKLLKWLELHAGVHSYFTIFILNVNIFTKNNRRFIISGKTRIYRHVICIFLTKNFKIFFDMKYLDLYISRRGFWRKLRIWYFFLLKNVIKKRNCKIRAHLPIRMS